MIERIGNVEVPLQVDTEAGRRIQCRLGGRTAIAGEALLPIAGIDRAHTGGSELADDVAVGLGDKKIAAGVEDYALRAVQVDGDRDDGTIRRHSPNSAVELIGGVDRA